MKKIYMLGIALVMSSMMNTMAQENVVVSFENQTLNSDGYWIGEVNETGVDDGYGGTTYTCGYDESILHLTTSYSVYYWSGYAISNRTDTVFADSYAGADQYNSAVGKAHSGNNFCVVYSYGQTIDITAEGGSLISGLYFTNSAVDMQSIMNGDSYMGEAFKQGDWLKLTVTGTKVDGTTASVETYLADYQSEKADDHYFVKDWRWLDLSALGTVKSLSFALSSSRANDYGMTTPNYFCIDDITIPVTTGISNAAAERTNGMAARYNLNGSKVAETQSGLQIVRMADGTVKKIMKR